MGGVTLKAPSSISTERLLLRPIVEADLEAVLDYRGSAQACRWAPFEPMDASAVQAKIHGDFTRTTLERQGEAIFYGVEATEVGELAGEVMLGLAEPEQRGGSMGWMLRASHEGHGYATEAAHALLHLAFDFPPGGLAQGGARPVGS